MPHDKHGQALKVGDKVRMEFTVTAVYPGADMCNVTLARNEPDEQSVSVTCQAKQTERISAPVDESGVGVVQEA